MLGSRVLRAKCRVLHAKSRVLHAATKPTTKLHAAAAPTKSPQKSYMSHEVSHETAPPLFRGATAPPPEGSELVCKGIGRLSNIVIERGEGSWVFTEEGERYLDFATGIGVCNLGHCHPKVTAAVHAQVDKIWHSQVNISYHKPMLDLLKKLGTVMPDPSLDTFFLWNSGAEAVESAVKLARHATGKPNVIVLQGGYHGRTLLTMSMTTSKTIFRKGYGPHNGGIYVAPFPYCHRCDCERKDPCTMPIKQLELLLKQQTAPEETAAIIFEPVLGEGGYVPAAPGYIQAVREICDKNNMLLIADEVQSGFGRTGKMWALDHYGVRPDVLIFAKGVASGLPLSGIASRRELMDKQPPGSQGGTYAGNAVACAAASATIDVLKNDGVLDNAMQQSSYFFDSLHQIQAEGIAPISDVRGFGLMIGVEFKGAPAGSAAAVSKACLERGLLLLSTSIFETVRFMPPLNLSTHEAETGVRIFREALQAVFG